MPKEYNDDDRVPKHPKTTDDYIKVQKWEEEFMDFLLSKGASRTARCGEAPRYPNRVEEGLLSTDKDTKKAAQLAKAKLDREANGKLFGWLCLATRETAPAVYRMIRDNKQFFDPSDEKREEGVGHKAWEAIVKRIASLAKDDDSLLDAVADRDEMGVRER